MVHHRFVIEGCGGKFTERKGETEKDHQMMPLSVGFGIERDKGYFFTSNEKEKR